MTTLRSGLCYHKSFCRLSVCNVRASVVVRGLSVGEQWGRDFWSGGHSTGTTTGLLLRTILCKCLVLMARVISFTWDRWGATGWPDLLQGPWPLPCSHKTAPVVHPTEGVEPFGNISIYPSHPPICVQNFTEIVSGEPPVGGVKHKR